MGAKTLAPPSLLGYKVVSVPSSSPSRFTGEPFAVTASQCFEALMQGKHSFVSLLSNRKRAIRWYLWLSWITFFLGCIATAGTSLLIWVFHFGVHDCILSSSGEFTCKDLQLAFKIVFTIVAALGCWTQSCPYSIDWIFHHDHHI